jgi:hypothetical protein
MGLVEGNVDIEIGNEMCSAMRLKTLGGIREWRAAA